MQATSDSPPFPSIMLGFLSSLPVVQKGGSRQATCKTCHTHATPAMKSKSSRKAARAAAAASKSKRNSKSGKSSNPVAATSSGEGGAEGSGVQPASASGEGSGDDDLAVDTGTGDIGDSTAHRAFNPSGRKKLVDPLAKAATMEEAASDVDAESASSEELAAELERLAAVRARVAEVAEIVADEAVRWPWATAEDEAVELLAKAKAEGALDLAVVTNRDRIGGRMLYRFTSAILQAEGDGADEEALNMRALRKDIIDCCWHRDRPLRDELFAAEARLVTVLQAAPESNLVGEVDANAGEGSYQVNAFWLVVYGAVAAWESRDADPKATEQDKAKSAEIQKRLNEIAVAINKSRTVEEHISPCLTVVGNVLVAQGQAEQAESLSKLDEAGLRELGAIMEQVRLWPTNAYGPFVENLQAVVDYAVSNLTGEEVPKISPFRYKRAEVESASKLIEFQKRNLARTQKTSIFG